MTDDRVERTWIEAGLLDPASPRADDRRALLQWLSDRGIGLEQMVAAHAESELVSLAGDLALRPGGRLTLDELAAASGTSVELADDLRRASGFPPNDTAPYSPEDVAMFKLFNVAASMFSRDELLHFTRVVASSMRRIAEAAGEMFLLDVEAPLVGEGGGTELARAETNLSAIELARAASNMFDPLFLRHLQLSIRTTRAARAISTDYSTVTLAVGFVDLTGFTSRAGQLGADSLLDLVLEFESAAYDLVAERGGRLVKLIGDEAMFTTVEPRQACDIAARLVARFDTGEGTSARGGVAYGAVVAHGGDVYGDTVNLASRIADTSVPGEVLVNGEVVERVSEIAFEPAGRRQLKGFAEPVRLWSLPVGG